MQSNLVHFFHQDSYPDTAQIHERRDSHLRVKAEKEQLGARQQIISKV